MHRELMRKANSACTLARPFTTLLSFKPPWKRQLQSLLLPHVLFSNLYNDHKLACLAEFVTTWWQCSAFGAILGSTGYTPCLQETLHCCQEHFSTCLDGPHFHSWRWHTCNWHWKDLVQDAHHMVLDLNGFTKCADQG